MLHQKRQSPLPQQKFVAVAQCYVPLLAMRQTRKNVDEAKQE
jgi:hypothetical protein